MSKLIAYLPEAIFTGSNIIHNHAVVVQDGIIVQVVPTVTVDKNSYHCVTLTNKILLPAFLDMQLYGAAGKLLSANPTVESVAAIADFCYANGTHYCLPTVATNAKEIIYTSIDAVKEYISKGGKHVLGIHIEGPWISLEKRGAHIAKYIHMPTIQEVETLIAYGKGCIKMITLAPEVCSKEIIQLLQNNNIIVAAGHSNATYNEAIDSFNKGINCATHLYNAMSGLQHRSPGMVGAIFNHSSVRASIIPDGHHVSYEAVAIAHKIMGNDRLYAITDAVTSTTMGDYTHTLVGDKYETNGILSGSALTMFQAFKNLVFQVHIPPTDAAKMCNWIPAKVLQHGDSIGLLKKGYIANIIATDKDFSFVENICFNDARMPF